MSMPKYVSSFAVGFAVGAGLTLVYAPMTGRKMQKKLARINDRVIDRVQDLKTAVVRAAS